VDETRGLAKEMLVAGTRATVVGYPHRSDASEMRAAGRLLAYF